MHPWSILCEGSTSKLNNLLTNWRIEYKSLCSAQTISEYIIGSKKLADISFLKKKGQEEGKFAK